MFTLELKNVSYAYEKARRFCRTSAVAGNRENVRHPRPVRVWQDYAAVPVGRLDVPTQGSVLFDGGT